MILIFGLKINYLNNNNIIKLFDLIIKYNYFISIQDFTFYLTYEIPK